MASQPAIFIFTDGSAHKEEKLCGIGMVFYSALYRENWFQIQDRIMERSEIYPGDRSSFAERLSIFRGLQIALEMGNPHVFLFNDHLSVVRKLNILAGGQAGKISEMEEKIIDLWGNFDFLKIGYVKKKKNSLAHKLSRKAFRD